MGIKTAEGGVSLNFELTKGQDVDAVVLTETGQPAAKAKVATGIPGSIVVIRDGDIDLGSNVDVREADAGGRVHFPPQLPGYFLVITHASGYANYEPSPHSNRRTIHLDPWTRVEGTLRVAGKPQANVPIWIDRGFTQPQNDRPHLSTTCHTSTGPEGRFVFERVTAGNGLVGPRLVFSYEGITGATSVRRVRAKFPLGQTVQMDLVGFGRRVVGKLRPPPANNKAVPWNFVEIQVAPLAVNGRRQNVYFEARVGSDGAFQIDDVPAGEFRFQARFLRGPVPFPGSWRQRFVVPAITSGQSAVPLDLGALTVSVRQK